MRAMRDDLGDGIPDVLTSCRQVVDRFSETCAGLATQTPCRLAQTLPQRQHARGKQDRQACPDERAS